MGKNHSFMLSEILSQSKDLWNKLKFGLSHDRKLQKIIECKKLIKTAVNFVSVKFKRKICLQYIRKTIEGFNVVFVCTKHSSGCRTRWRFEINIKDTALNVIRKNICNHESNYKPSGFFFIASFMK